MRRANGSGQIFRIIGAHRRNSWRVRIFMFVERKGYTDASGFSLVLMVEFNDSDEESGMK